MNLKTIYIILIIVALVSCSSFVKSARLVIFEGQSLQEAENILYKAGCKNVTASISTKFALKKNKEVKALFYTLPDKTFLLLYFGAPKSSNDFKIVTIRVGIKGKIYKGKFERHQELTQIKELNIRDYSK